MEIGDLNLIGDFEAGIKCLQNPAPFSLISSIHKVPHPFSFWKWGALILAFFATFRSIIKRIKLFLHQIRLKALLSYEKPCSPQIFNDDDFDFEFSDDDDDTPSVTESDDEDSDSEDIQRPAYEIFRAEGSNCYWGNNRGLDENAMLRRRDGFCWSEFPARKSVVQLWDASDFEDDADSEFGSEIGIGDFDRYVKVSSSLQCDVSPVTANVVMTAEMNYDGGVGFGSYCGSFAVTYDSWRPREWKSRFKDNGGGVEQVMELKRRLPWMLTA